MCPLTSETLVPPHRPSFVMNRYPLEAPLVLVTNESLPPGLARKIVEAANAQAGKLVSATCTINRRNRPSVDWSSGWLIV